MQAKRSCLLCILKETEEVGNSFLLKIEVLKMILSHETHTAPTHFLHIRVSADVNVCDCV